MSSDRYPTTPERAETRPSETSATSRAEISTADERYVNEFIRALDGFTAEPWWWQAAGHSTEEWERDRRRAAIANKCPARIHDDPIFCDLGIGPIGPDGLARCHEPWIRHVLRPTGNPDRPWADTGRRERAEHD